MGNFFSSDEFFNAFGQVRYPNGNFQIENVEVNGTPFRLLKSGRKYALSIPFQDFYEPSYDLPQPRTKIPYIPEVCLKSVPTSEWLQMDKQGKAPSPLIDWKKYSSWEDYVSWTHGVSKRAFKKKDTAYQWRRLEREIGEVSIDFESNDPKILELCFEWKSAQYRASKFVDALAENSFNRAFFRQMFTQGLLTIAVMKAADTVLAIHIGAVQDGRFYYWIPAYDPAYSKHSAGKILLEKMIEWSYRQGHNEFDFLAGGETYKYFYASDVRMIQSIGTPPLAQRVWKPVRKKLIVSLRKQKRIYEFAQDMKRQIRNRSFK